MPRRPSNLVRRRIVEFVKWKGKLEMTEYGKLYFEQLKANKLDETHMPAWMKKMNKRTASKLSGLIRLLDAKEKKYGSTLQNGNFKQAEKLDGEITKLKTQIAILMGIN